jgi:hypothetical protein
VGEINQRESNSVAEKVVEYLHKHGATTRTDLIAKCLGGHVHRARLDEALDLLLMNNPPSITLNEEPKKEGGGRSRKTYSLNASAKFANNASLGAGSGIAGFASPANIAKFDPQAAPIINQSSQSSQTTQTEKTPASRASSQTPQSSQSSRDELTKAVIEVEL